jgi:hypothetical protein
MGLKEERESSDFNGRDKKKVFWNPFHRILVEKREKKSIEIDFND